MTTSFICNYDWGTTTSYTCDSPEEFERMVLEHDEVCVDKEHPRKHHELLEDLCYNT